MYGGEGIGASGDPTSFDDLWKYEDNAWIWVSGPQVFFAYVIAGPLPTYGKLNSPTLWTDPGSRYFPQFWVQNGIVWMFGGYGRTNTEFFY